MLIPPTEKLNYFSGAWKKRLFDDFPDSEDSPGKRKEKN